MNHTELWALWFPDFEEYARPGSANSGMRVYVDRHEAEADAERTRDRLRPFAPDFKVEVRRITGGNQ